MQIQEIKQNHIVLFECISGSKAYGLDTPQSDTDIRGVFALNQTTFFGLDDVEQVNNNTNDIVFYELKRLTELLLKNNPNILELVNMPSDCVLYEHPLFERLKQMDFISKLCRDTFGGYAVAQVKKARGLNKKILNPLPPARKTILDFCYVTHQNGSLPMQDWLIQNQFKQENCGLVNVANMREMYALFYDFSGGLHYKGIIQDANSNEVSLSSTPKGELPLTYLFFNKDGYSVYCREYREYWEWVERRNDARYENTLEHGKNYDSKNLMHTFRLLDMAEEIAKEGKIIVRRPNREFLFKIRKGEFDYEYLVQIAEERIQWIDELFAKSHLPERPDKKQINEVLVEIRMELYKS